jgi:hypothetical protein
MGIKWGQLPAISKNDDDHLSRQGGIQVIICIKITFFLSSALVTGR